MSARSASSTGTKIDAVDTENCSFFSGIFITPVVARYEAHRRKRRPNPAAVGVRPTLAVRLTSTALGRVARWFSSRVLMLKRSEGALYPVGSVRVRPHSSYSRYTEGNQAHPCSYVLWQTKD